MINNGCLKEYYPFQLSRQKRICLSVRYLPLIEDFLEEIDLDYELHESTQNYKFGITFPEYQDEDFISFAVEEVSEMVNQNNLRSYSFEIKVIKEITLDRLYGEICSAYYADKWYPQIEDLTFRSVLLDLSDEHVRYLLDTTLLQPSCAALPSLEAILNLKFAELNSELAFVRLYSLSPKSATSSPIDLSAKCASDVIRILKTSKRAQNSLAEDYKHGIMLREFQHNIDPKWEFRLFIFGDSLTAISQYNCYEYYEEFDDPDLRETIKCKIDNWFKTIRKRINYRDYVMDIFLDGGAVNPQEGCIKTDRSAVNPQEGCIKTDRSAVNPQEGCIKIVEINSFGPGLLAGSGLFNWVDDYEIMHSGLEIRFANIYSQ